MSFAKLALGHNAIYVDSKGHQKVALIIGTSQSIAEGTNLDTIPEGHFNIIVTSASGRQYAKKAVPSATTASSIDDYYDKNKNLVSVLYPLDSEIPSHTPVELTDEEKAEKAAAESPVVVVLNIPKPGVYTHTGNTPVTDPEGSLIDIDGEPYVIGKSANKIPGTDDLPCPLISYDYTLVAKLS